ncbi:preprotein translocase subunit SecE [Snodgrassella gandavensis]|uniref:preprotein translocase subunit SecE n=1 Tax=Snodgrassella gandavensis TaxID=2946698 RepID=UPI001EF440B5|nr:preprotein translocase subunit SecE [Snodgrassella gandavensis]
MDNKTSKDVGTKTKAQLKAEAKQQQQLEIKRNKRFDFLKYILSAILIAAGIMAFYALDAQLPLYIRYLFPLVGVVAAIIIVFFWSAGGRELTAYVRDSVSEARKVVWPERNETLRMTLFVLMFVAVLSIFIWGVDSLISWLLFDIFMKRS